LNLSAPEEPLEPPVDSEEVIVIRERKLRILLVDDHDLFRSGVAFHLREVYGAEVYEEETGDGALEIAGGGFDLILMDIKMPVSVDGLAACEEIRRRSLAVQVVLMTAELTAERYERAKALATTLLSKPLDFECLKRILLGCPGGSPS
jgi:CheY-like chemotaxis protein